MPSMISIVIPCYNQAHYIAEAVQSALAQDWPAKEVIVVDDGSTDGSGNVLAAAFGNRIVYIRQSNRGISGARNAGFRASKADYVLFLDGDDALIPGVLRAPAEYLDRNPGVGFVCGDTVCFGEGGGLPADTAPYPGDGEEFRNDCIYFCPQAGTALIRRECLIKAGLFDEDMKGGAEDWLLWVRIARFYPMVHIAHPMVRYRQHPGSATRNVERITRYNRIAARKIVEWDDFGGYPARLRARLLIFRCATAWRVEPRSVAMGYLWSALRAAPGEWRFAMQVLLHALRRRRQRMQRGEG